MILNFQKFNESLIDQKRLLKSNLPVQIYRGISNSGINFYSGSEPLPFTYYSLSKEKAEKYGNVTKFIFNPESKIAKIFYAKDFFHKFGMKNVEDKDVIRILKAEGYDAFFQKGDELIVLNPSIVKRQ